MNVYAGFDLSLSATGYAILSNDHTIALGTIKTKPGEPIEDRLAAIADRVVDLIAEHRPDFIAMESPSFGSPFGAHDMGQVHGAVAYALRKAGHAQPSKVAPGTVKKFVTGSGRAEKSDVKMAIYKRWGLEIKDNNQADAYVIGRIGGCVHGGIQMETEEQRECVATVSKRRTK